MLTASISKSPIIGRRHTTHDYPAATQLQSPPTVVCSSTQYTYHPVYPTDPILPPPPHHNLYQREMIAAIPPQCHPNTMLVPSAAAATLQR